MVGGIDGVKLMVGLYDLEGLLQPKLFHDSMILIYFFLMSRRLDKIIAKMSYNFSTNFK